MDEKRITTSPAQFELMQRMLTMDPQQRITAGEALAHDYFNQDPKPMPDVFDGLKIPYPSRDVSILKAQNLLLHLSVDLLFRS